jgi:hypothetical protein
MKSRTCSAVSFPLPFAGSVALQSLQQFIGAPNLCAAKHKRFARLIDRDLAHSNRQNDLQLHYGDLPARGSACWFAKRLRLAASAGAKSRGIEVVLPTPMLVGAVPHLKRS